MVALVVSALFVWNSSVHAQTIATARPAAVSSGRPSSIAIRANILQMQQAQIQAQIVVAQRCIRDATQSGTFRDPQGNVNVVPQTDAVNCARDLAALTRRLNSLVRESRRLAQDSTFQGTYLQRRASQAAYLNRVGAGRSVGP
jgi:hypothetical protein